MRLTIVLSNIRGGGAPFAAVNWANAWSRRGHDVHIIAMLPDEGAGADFFVEPSIPVRRIDLADRPVKNRWGALRGILARSWKLRRAILATRPDAVLCFAGPLNVRMLMALWGVRLPKIVMEQTHPGMESFGDFWERWRVRLYPGAAMLLNLTQAAQDWCLAHFKVRRAAVIPNPVLPVKGRADTGPGGPRVLVAAGRLVDQKRFDLLIDAYARIAGRHPDWRLVLYGEGPNRADLERRVREAGLGDAVSLPGWTDDLKGDMLRGGLFVLSSEYEGFGNVVAEALAAGLPVVSFDCLSGPGDIVRHGVDGLLVPPLDVAALAEALDRVMSDDALRRSMGERAPEVVERFSLEHTLELWERCFEQAIDGYVRPDREDAK